MSKSHPKSVRIEIEYYPAHETISASDVADQLEPDATDEEIERAIREHVGEIITDRPWPSFRLRNVDALVPGVREVLAERAKEAEDE